MLICSVVNGTYQPTYLKDQTDVCLQGQGGQYVNAKGLVEKIRGVLACPAHSLARLKFACTPKAHELSARLDLLLRRLPSLQVWCKSGECRLTIIKVLL